MSDSIVQINGSQGEGGGQMVRSSLALALVTGRGVEIKNIRAKRQKPGLMQQQLTAVRAPPRLEMPRWKATRSARSGFASGLAR